MGGHIFLSGGGDENDSAELDYAFLAQVYKGNLGRRILYVPLALHASSYNDAIEWFEKMVRNHQQGEINIDTITSVEKLVAVDLSNYGAVYFGGGNTYRLLSSFHTASTASKLRDYFELGGVIYGGSAGAIVLGANIETVPEERYQEFAGSPKGVDLLNRASVHCHTNRFDVNRLIKCAEQIGSPILGLSEKSGLHIKATTCSSLGSEQIWIVKPDRTVIQKNANEIFYTNEW